jgi:hypothetical protein
MKNILYICTKNQYDWDSIIPHQEGSSTTTDVSVLLLQDGIDPRTIPTSHLFRLKAEEKEINHADAQETVSYQDFLEKIFLMDLAVMI